MGVSLGRQVAEVTYESRGAERKRDAQVQMSQRRAFADCGRRAAGEAAPSRCRSRWAADRLRRALSRPRRAPDDAVPAARDPAPAGVGRGNPRVTDIHASRYPTAMNTGTVPTLKELIKARFDIVREDLDEVTARLSDDMLAWAPAPGMRTIKGQLEEIAGTEVQAITWMRDRAQIPYEEAMAFGDKTETLDGLRSVLRTVRTSTLEYLDSLSEQDLATPAPFPERWFESLRLPSVPPSEAFRSIAQHEWYHVGQLVSYLWARGDDPYKW